MKKGLKYTLVSVLSAAIVGCGAMSIVSGVQWGQAKDNLKIAKENLEEAKEETADSEKERQVIRDQIQEVKNKTFQADESKYKKSFSPSENQASVAAVFCVDPTGYGSLGSSYPIATDLDADVQYFVTNGHVVADYQKDGQKLYVRLENKQNVPAEVSVTLVEKTRNPFALNTSLVHDAYSGKNSIEMSWNVEPPVFFDDFESYEPFAIQFGEWTGIDGDDEFTAPLLGSYPNRGVKQYAQIINPLTVIPTWWYDYPILRPYSGNQYAGFIRTNSGNANDDWLISPVITPGIDNVLQFMVKAADRFTERFQVYVTTKTDNPQASDFVRIDQGNYETLLPQQR